MILQSVSDSVLSKEPLIEGKKAPAKRASALFWME